MVEYNPLDIDGLMTNGWKIISFELPPFGVKSKLNYSVISFSECLQAIFSVETDMKLSPHYSDGDIVIASVRLSCCLVLNHWGEFNQTCYMTSPHGTLCESESICPVVHQSVMLLATLACTCSVGILLWCAMDCTFWFPFSFACIREL